MRGDLQEGYFALLDANFLSSWCQFPFSRAQNRGFCAFLAFGAPIFWHSEHKIGVFVLFWPSNPRFRAFRAQNQGFCALLAFGTPVFRLFKHKIGIFVLGEVCSGGLLGLCYSGRAAQRVLLLPGECCLGCGAVYLLAARRAKSSFLKVAASVKSSACMPAAMAPSTLAGLSSVKRHSEALSPNFWQSRS